MTIFLQNITETDETIKAVPLANLFLSPLNPRQQVPDEDIIHLAQSIKAVGLLQNLVGLEAKRGKIEIVAGGRRLAALKKLADLGEISDKTEILVRLAKDHEDALICATTENDARQNLSPAQEVRAYRAMRDVGMNAENIAKANAQTVRHVKGRLRLAALPEIILTALDESEITLDTAAAYTVSDNPDQQAKIFEELSANHWNKDNPSMIKRALMNEIPEADSLLAKFVTRKTYEEAGGAIREDLFKEDAYFLNPELLNTLANEKMETIKSDLLAQGWKWVSVFPESRNYELIQAHEHLNPMRQQLNDQEADRLQVLEDAQSNEEITDEEQAELEQLETKMKPYHTDEQKAHSGVIVYLSYRGEPDLSFGVVHSDDVEAAVEAGLIDTHQPIKKTTEEDNSAFSQALTADLATIHTGAFQSAILDNPDYALDLAIFALANPSYIDAGIINIGAKHIKNQIEDHGQTLTDELEPNHQRPLSRAGTFAAFDAFKKLSKENKLMMLADTIARATGVTLINDDCQDHIMRTIAKDLSVNPRNTWTPNSTFFKRMKATQLDQVMGYVLGKQPADSFTKMGKSDKVARLHAIFNNETDRRGFSEDEKQRIADWIPEGFVQEQSNVTPITKTTAAKKKKAA